MCLCKTLWIWKQVTVKKKKVTWLSFFLYVYIYNLLNLVAFCEIGRQCRFRVNTAKNGGSFKKFKIKPGMFGWHFFHITFLFELFNSCLLPMHKPIKISSKQYIAASCAHILCSTTTLNPWTAKRVLLAFSDIKSRPPVQMVAANLLVWYTVHEK